MKKIVLLLLFVLIAPSSLPAQGYRDVTPDDRVRLPDDLYFKKDYRVQWWYFTGHLETEGGREFGYELTFFVAGVQRRRFRSEFGMNHVYMSHLAISDIQSGTYLYGDRMDGGAFGFSGADGRALRVWVEEDTLEGSLGEIHIRGSGEGMEIDLDLTPRKPPVLNGQGGYSRKSQESPLHASLYFSLTDVATTGVLKTGEGIFRVEGKSWFDREISSKRLSGEQVGWDWFSIQLDDGREIMLYSMRRQDGSVDMYSSGTFVYLDGTYRHLARDDFSITVLDHYRSEKTKARYPAAWDIKVPSENLELTITPTIEDQEFIGSYSLWNRYWEGACRVTGSATGRAYVELTGYQREP